VSYLLDTCLLSELPKAHPNAGVVAWIETTDESLCYVSVLTLGELLKGIEKLADGQRKKVIRDWFEQDVVTRFQDRILSADLGICLRWGQLSADLSRRGCPRPALDALLASTALVNDLVLVTRNERDFAHTGVKIINPWT
jgi:predicted nucleic acid-binding protein